MTLSENEKIDRVIAVAVLITEETRVRRVQALADDNRKFLNCKSNLSRSGDACNSSPRGIVGHQGNIWTLRNSWAAGQQLDRTAGH